MYMGNLDNRNVFRSDKTITNVMYQASKSRYDKPCCCSHVKVQSIKICMPYVMGTQS